MTHTFNNGDIVRFKSGGDRFTLVSINPNPDYDPEDENWADGEDEGGYVEVNNPDDIELVMSAAAAAARTIPDRDELARWLSGALHSAFGDEVSVYETEPQEDGTVLVAATVENGLDITFAVQVVWVE